MIGIKGKAGSGKDTVANYLVEHHGYKKVTFADPIKEIVSIITGVEFEMLAGQTEESRRFREEHVFPEYGKTARQLMQLVGTDLFRNHFDPDIWLKVFQRRVKKKVEDEDKIVISDVRFANEAKMIQDLGGCIIHLERDIEYKVTSHVSENTPRIENEIVIKNNGTLEDLYSQIEKLL